MVTHIPHIGHEVQEGLRGRSAHLRRTASNPVDIAHQWPETPSERPVLLLWRTLCGRVKEEPVGRASAVRFAGGVRGGPDVCAGGVADRTVRTHVKGRREPSGAVLEACGASLRSRAEQVGVLAVQRGSAPGVRTALRAGDVLSSKTAAS